jgi:hypothetical protein
LEKASKVGTLWALARTTKRFNPGGIMKIVSMIETDFPSTIAYMHPSGTSLVPAVEQLKALRQQALREGRPQDAGDYERMMRHLSSRMQEQRGDISLWKKAALAAFLSLFLVLAVHYLV